MSLKRKLESEEQQAAPVHARPTKQLRIQPPTFSTVQSQDVNMSDAAVSPPSASEPSPDSEAPCYPTFDLYPFPSYGTGDVEMDTTMEAHGSTSTDSRTSSNASETTPSVGLLQPKSSFVHNFSNCTQIPRLRVACETGIQGSRSFWTQCDDCGAIEMVDM